MDSSEANSVGDSQDQPTVHDGATGGESEEPVEGGVFEISAPVHRKPASIAPRLRDEPTEAADERVQTQSDRKEPPPLLRFLLDKSALNCLALATLANVLTGSVISLVLMLTLGGSMMGTMAASVFFLALLWLVILSASYQSACCLGIITDTPTGSRSWATGRRRAGRNGFHAAVHSIRRSGLSHARFRSARPACAMVRLMDSFGRRELERVAGDLVVDTGG